MSEHPVPIKVLPSGEGLDLPAYATELAAGCDLVAAVPDGKPVVLRPGGRALVPTGFALGLDPDFEAQVRPRSGLALRHGVTVLNAPGTVDADYRGEVQVLLVNHGNEPFEITRGMRIAQMILAPVARARFVPRGELDDTDRGGDGFGSTGTGATSE